VAASFQEPRRGGISYLVFNCSLDLPEQSSNAAVELHQTIQERSTWCFVSSGVSAVVDNETHNIAAMSEVDMDDEILFLHAKNFLRPQGVPPPRTKSVNQYDVTWTVSYDEKTTEGSLV
jgi:hypothetical protein